jgi:hypothetical protein
MKLVTNRVQWRALVLAALIISLFLIISEVLKFYPSIIWKKHRLNCDVVLVSLLAMDRDGYCSSNALYVYTGGTLFASRPWQRFFPEGFHGLPQSLQANSELVPRSGHNRLFPRSFTNHPTNRHCIVRDNYVVNPATEWLEVLCIHGFKEFRTILHT